MSGTNNEIRPVCKCHRKYCPRKKKKKAYTGILLSSGGNHIVFAEGKFLQLYKRRKQQRRSHKTNTIKWLLAYISCILDPVSTYALEMWSILTEVSIKTGYQKGAMGRIVQNIQHKKAFLYRSMGPVCSIHGFLLFVSLLKKKATKKYQSSWGINLRVEKG